MIRGTDRVVNTMGGGPMVLVKVGPRLRMISVFKAALALCQTTCRSLLYLATAIWAFVIPLMMGMWVGSVDRGAMTSVPSGANDLFTL